MSLKYPKHASVINLVMHVFCMIELVEQRKHSWLVWLFPIKVYGKDVS